MRTAQHIPSVALVFALLLFPKFASAQTSLSPELKFLRVNPDQVSIEFYSAKKIQTLVVMISDSLGNTLFLENQFRFTGSYKKTIPLKKQNREKFYLEVIKDDEQVSAKIE